MFNPLLISGMIIVNGALILYTLGFIFEVKTKSVSRKILALFTTGVTLDITSTALMILGSRKFNLTLAMGFWDIRH